MIITDGITLVTLSDHKVYDAHRPMRLGPDFAPSPKPPEVGTFFTAPPEARSGHPYRAGKGAAS
jgi:hypothetical protein